MVQYSKEAKGFIGNRVLTRTTFLVVASTLTSLVVIDIERHRWDFVLVFGVLIGLHLGWFAFSRRGSKILIVSIAISMIGFGLCVIRQLKIHSLNYKTIGEAVFIDTRSGQIVCSVRDPAMLNEIEGILLNGSFVRPTAPRLSIVLKLSSHDGSTHRHLRLNQNGICLPYGEDFEIGKDRMQAFMCRFLGESFKQFNPQSFKKLSGHDAEHL